MYRRAIVVGRNSIVERQRVANRTLDPVPGSDLAVDRCLEAGRAYEASRLMLAALGRRRQPLD